MATRAEIEWLIGRRAHVRAPAYPGMPASPLHDQTVSFLRFSPTQPEIVRTSGGPLQWTRQRLFLKPCDGDDAPIGCGEPVLGAQALGPTLAPSVQEHVSRCLACQLERVAFERFEQGGEHAE